MNSSHRRTGGPLRLLSDSAGDTLDALALGAGKPRVARGGGVGQADCVAEHGVSDGLAAERLPEALLGGGAGPLAWPEAARAGELGLECRDGPLPAAVGAALVGEYGGGARRR